MSGVSMNKGWAMNHIPRWNSHVFALEDLCPGVSSHRDAETQLERVDRHSGRHGLGEIVQFRSGVGALWPGVY